MTKFGKVLIFVLLPFFALPIVANDLENILQNPATEFLADESAGIDLNNALKVSDGNLDTAAQIDIESEQSVELVYTFSELVFSPSEIRVNVSGLERDQANLEILVSEDGADTGYLSLRVEPLKKTDNWQTFKFESAAAKWMILKFESYQSAISFNINEIEVEGHEGTPISLYAFNEAPADALDVLKELEQSDLQFDLHQDELSLFADAADGALDEWTFAEAALMSSGILDSAERQEVLSTINGLTTEAESITADANGAFEKGKLLLEWLHSGAMKNGYIEGQTDMAAVVRDGSFNCVSSATLYNIIARRLQLDARAIEVPDHAFSILYDGTEHADVETTTPHGFDPARDRAAMQAFSRTTGFTYINDKNRSKRRELDEAGTVALTYYNHGVTASKNEDYPAALLNYFRALSLDPLNKSAIKNTLSVLSNWGVQEIENDNPQRAVDILEAALNFAPDDRHSRHNMRYAMSKAMQAAPDTEAMSALVAKAENLHKLTNDKTFLRLRSQVLQNKAFELANSDKFDEALALTESIGPDADEATQRSIARLRQSLYLNWSSALIDSKNFSDAIDVLEVGLKEKENDYRLKNNVAFAAQEWGAAVSTTEGPDAASTLLVGLSERFPDIRQLQRVAARNYDVDAKAAFDAADYETAIDIYQSAQALGIDASRMKNNEKVAWNNWGLALMDQSNHPGALQVFEKALLAHPRNSQFNNNVTYIVQEWAREINQTNGVAKAEETVFLQQQRFADVSGVKRLQGMFINNAVNDSRSLEDFSSLEPSLISVEAYSNGSKYDRLVAYFYQEWAKAVNPKFEDVESMAVLQSGVENFPENRQVKQLFLQVVNFLGGRAAAAQDWQQALSIFQSASRSLPGQREIERKIDQIREQL